MTAGRLPGARRLVGAAFVLVAFLFLGSLVAKNLQELRGHQWEVRPLLLAASVLVNLVGLGWGVVVWRQLLRQTGFRVPYRDLARIYFVSNLGRYIPGKIWQFVGAAHLGAAAGLQRAVTVSSLAAHALIFLIAAALASIYLLPPEALGVAGASLGVMRWLAPLLLLLVHPAVFRSLLRLLRRVSGKIGEIEWSGSWGGSIVLVGMALVGWVLTGSALYLFILSLTPIAADALVPVAGMNALSFLAGYASIAPAGLAFKEVSLTLLLSTYLSAPVAALLAIAARLWTIAAEVIPALFLMPSGMVGRASRPSDSGSGSGEASGP